MTLNMFYKTFYLPVVSMQPDGLILVDFKDFYLYKKNNKKLHAIV